jgi:Rha family phage regulatory protein
MTTNTKQKAAGAINTNGLHTDTNSTNSRTSGALDQADTTAIVKPRSASLTIVSTAPIQVKGQSLFIASNVIASLFGRPHKNVMRDIDQLVEAGTISRLNLELRDYLDSRGKAHRSYILTERDALVLMPFLGGRKAAEGQAKLVDEFLRMRSDLRRIASRKSDPAIQLARSQKCAASTLMTDVLVDVRAALGKETKPHHFSNEHRLCNRVLTGDSDHIDDSGLDHFAFRRLKAIRMMNARLISQSLAFHERKAALRKAFPQPKHGGDLDNH